jgi:glycosyltransferase involved in cell wall biosynthesis
MRLVVVEPNGRGGLVHYAYQMCTALAEAGAEVTLVTARDYELSRFPHNFRVEARLDLWQLFDPKPMGAPPRSLPGRLWRKSTWTLRRGLRAARLIRAWVRLTGYLIRLRPDVVQFGKINFPFEALFLARLRRRGLVLGQVCHEFERREQRGLFARAVDRLYASVYDTFSAIFFHAGDNRERFLSLFDVPRERTHLIPHGNEGLVLAHAARLGDPPDLRARYGLEPGQPVVLFFGVLSPSKGLPDLLDAFAAVARSSPARLIIAGYPSKFIDVGDLEAQAQRLGIAERVTFDTRYIPIEEVAPLMELATVVALPYRSSTQSGALQVAYAFGRPVIATEVGGLPEAVEDGHSGFLVPPESPGMLADKILALVDDPALAARMGDHARRLSETRYSWGPIAARVLSAYAGVLGRDAPPSAAAPPAAGSR